MEWYSCDNVYGYCFGGPIWVNGCGFCEMVAIWDLPIVKIWGFWLFIVKQLMNLIFIVYLELVEESHLGFVMVGIVIYVVVLWVSWKWHVYWGRNSYSVRISYGKGEAWNDMMISWSLCLVMKLLRNFGSGIHYLWG